MGGIFSANDKVRPSELDDIQNQYHRQNSGYSDEFKCKNRSTTDICFLLFFTIFLTVLLCFVGYCIFYGDIFRVINGYDNCGNVCGRVHYTLRHGEKRPSICHEIIETRVPYHIVLRRNNSKEVDRLCVSDCSLYEGYRRFFNRCIPNRNKDFVNSFLSKTGLKNFFSEVSEDFHLCWPEFCYLCLISLVLSMLILILFRYLVGFVVWIVLITTVLVCLVGSVLLWLMWHKSKTQIYTQPIFPITDLDSGKTDTYFVFAIVSTVITFIVITVIFVMRKHINLVVQIFHEAGKSLAAMPLLLFQPVLTFIFLGIVVSLWFYFSLWIESSGILTQKRTNVYFFQKDGWMKFTRWYNFFAMLWAVQFVIGCQHMVIAGAVSAWYFTRDKSKLDSPVVHSIYNLTRYHLGSVAMGSFIIALVQFARAILQAIEKYLNNKEGTCVNCTLKCCKCCLFCFEQILKYLTRNAYIEVAIFGYSFCEGGKQAFKIISSNVMRVAAINSVGDFVLFLGKVLVVIATVLIGIKMLQNKDGVQHIWVPVTLAGLFAYFVSHCFLTVYEMSIDTIFLCFCEDCQQNDGVIKPYYMSRGLMEFVENSKKVLQMDRSKSRKINAWQPVRTVSGTVEKNSL